MIMKKIIYLTIVLQFLPAVVFSAQWQRKVVNHDRAQYKAGFQNWMIAQAENGWMYFGNSEGLLEFDGVNWTLYPIKNKIVRSIKVIGEKIYVGGSSEFGFFEPNEKGLLVYKSLSNSTNHWVGQIWNIFAHSGKLYFICDNHIHIFDSNNNFLKSINANMKIDCSTIIGNKIYAGSFDGVFYLENDSALHLLEGTHELKGQKLVSILPYKDKLLVTTAENGLYFTDNQYTKKVTSIADDFISKNRLFYTSISESLVVLGSVQNGIFLFDLENNNYSEFFNINTGLTDNTVLSSFFDKEQNLWIGLAKGIGYMDFNSIIHPLFSNVSPIGAGYCSQVYNGELYLGTNQGLYKIDKKGNYQMVRHSEGQIWSMNIIDDKLFCSGDNKIIIITSSEIYDINVTGVWGIHTLKQDKNILLAGTYSGLYILRKENGKWRYSHKIDNFDASSRSLMEDDVNYTFWTTNAGEDIKKISFDKDFTKVEDIKTYNLPDNLVIGENIFFRRIYNNIVVCAEKGIFEYSRITDSFTGYSQLESMLDGLKYYEYLSVDNLNNIWFVTDKKLKFLPYSPKGYKSNTVSIGLTDKLINNYENVYLIDSTSSIIAIDNAFVKVDLTKETRPSIPINTYFRKIISINNDSVLSYGNSQFPIVIPYELNSIGIHFVATNYPQSSDIMYSHRLSGVDEDWSIPSYNIVKEYTKLHEGRYKFEVRCIVNGNINADNTASIEFTILPPWYRSITAYATYSLFIMMFSIALYNKTIKKQKKIIHQKGEELIAQTKHYEEETQLKNREIIELQNENLKNELQYKTQELTGYILNTIRKNEMLEEVKKNAIKISRAIDEEKQLSVVRQKVVRLIGQIDNNIEHDTDFEVFKSNFDIVHQDFFKFLDERFPKLSKNDKILCVYLNMNLSSKEIAPLLNISIRGVEVNRYRLRKKMNLDRDVNLSEYLQKLVTTKPLLSH